MENVSTSNTEIGKPLLYLDHNVLDAFTKGNSDGIAKTFKEKWQTVYSLESLFEIKRSKGFEAKFTDLLRSLDALYLDAHLDGDHRISDRATLERVDPWIKLQELGQDDIGSDLVTAMKLFALKMIGGRKDLEFKEVIEFQREAFSKLMDSLEGQLSEMDPQLVNGYIREMRDKFSVQLEEMERVLTENHKDGKDFEGIKAFRKALEVSPLELNNIQSPKVIEQIWKIISSNEIYSAKNLTLETAIGIATNYAYQGKPFYLFEKAFTVYGFLNSVGYHPDTDVTKERRFTASSSDQNHVAYAGFANIFLTMDNRLARKAAAAYEFLGMSTTVVNLNDSLNEVESESNK